MPAKIQNIAVHVKPTQTSLVCWYHYRRLVDTVGCEMSERITREAPVGTHDVLGTLTIEGWILRHKPRHPRTKTLAHMIFANPNFPRAPLATLGHISSAL